MKKIYFLLCAMISVATIANAQTASNYFFGTKSNVPLADLSSGSIEMIGPDFNPYDDEVSSAVFPIGFTFRFNNVDYTSFSANENGYLGLGQSQVVNSSLNSFTPEVDYPGIAIPYPAIAAWWEDLYTADNGNVSYKLTGNPGSQKLVVQWKVRAFHDNERDTYSNVFQIWLFEGSNKIQFVYGQGYASIFNAATIGIAASGTNFLSYSETVPSVGNAASYNQNRAWPAGVNSLIFSPTAIVEDPVVTPIVVAGNGVKNNVTCPGANNGSITLGSISGGTGTYTISWTGPNGFSASGAVLTSLAKGVYTYTVTDAVASPAATGSFEILEPTASLQNTYAIVGLKSVSIGENNIVKGSIGNTGSGGKVSVEKNAEIKGFIKSAVIAVNGTSSVSGGLFKEVAVVTMPAELMNTSITSGLSNINIPDDYAGAAISGNFKDVTVGKRANVTFTGSIFGKINVKEGADVVFSSSDVSLSELATDNGKASAAGTDFTTVTFAPNSIIRVKTKLNIAERNQVLAPNGTFYMSDNNTDAENITINGKSTSFNANVLMLHGKLNVKGADANNVGTMSGLFIAEVINSEKYINWNRSLCSETAQREIVSTLEAILQPASKMNVFPNPSNGAFSVKVDQVLSPNAMIVVYDQSGKEIMQRKISINEGGQKLSFNLSSNAPGLYLVKMVNGGEVQTTKVVVSK